MSDTFTETGTRYNKWVGLVYVFNLIVGTGALTMPKAFQTAGWLLSLTTIIVLSFMSFLTVTFVTEAMSIANAVLKVEKGTRTRERVSINDGDLGQTDSSERQPLLTQITSINDKIFTSKSEALSVFQSLDKKKEMSPYEITERTELGQMASMFFNKAGIFFFNICIIVYLYGDLAIYAAAVPKSLRDITCTYKLPSYIDMNGTKICNETLKDSDMCWSEKSFTRLFMYRMYVLVFFGALGVFTFFNIQKTKYLQLLTTSFRWIAFGMMIVLAIMRLSKAEGQGHPSVAEFSGVPNLFGVCVYSFMCHHSLPSLITPIKNKSNLYVMLGCDYVMILLFYLLVSFTGIYAFREVNDIYTLNFLPDSCDTAKSITNVAFIQYFLALFPVFTLSTNFPIISITLRNNLKAIGHNPEKPYPWLVDRIVFPLLALIPPMGIAIATNHVEVLVGITGSYAGAGIQYLIPALLVFCARRQTVVSLDGTNIHASPFRGKVWILFVSLWAVMCIGFVTVNHIITRQ